MNNREIINRLSHFMFLNDIVESGAYAKLSGSAKIIYPIIGLHINRDGEAFPSISRIEKLSGITRKSVIKGVKELLENGFITKVKGSARENRPNRYRIVFEYEGSVINTLGQYINSTSPSENNPPSLVEKMHRKVVEKFHPNKVIYNKLIQPIHKKQEVTTNIINIQDSQVNISKDSGSSNIFQKIVHELELKDTGKDLLKRYIDNYSEDWVNRAFTESVKRSNPSLHYIEGILRKWEEQGKIQQGTLNDAVKQKEEERKNQQRIKQQQEEQKTKEQENKRKLAEEIFTNLSQKEKEAITQKAMAILQNEGITEKNPGYKTYLKIKQHQLVLNTPHLLEIH